MSLIDARPLEWEALLCCFLSVLVIGLERQLRGKPVGIRTSAVICVGTYVFIAMARPTSSASTDLSRIIARTRAIGAGEAACRV